MPRSAAEPPPLKQPPWSAAVTAVGHTPSGLAEPFSHGALKRGWRRWRELHWQQWPPRSSLRCAAHRVFDDFSNDF